MAWCWFKCILHGTDSYLCHELIPIPCSSECSTITTSADIKPGHLVIRHRLQLSIIELLPIQGARYRFRETGCLHIDDCSSVTATEQFIAGGSSSGFGLYDVAYSLTKQCQYATCPSYTCESMRQLYRQFKEGGFPATGSLCHNLMTAKFGKLFDYQLLQSHRPTRNNTAFFPRNIMTYERFSSLPCYTAPV